MTWDVDATCAIVACDDCGRAVLHADAWRAEQAAERAASDYYGAASPMTIVEQYRAAWRRGGQ